MISALSPNLKLLLISMFLFVSFSHYLGVSRALLYCSPKGILVSRRHCRFFSATRNPPLKSPWSYPAIFLGHIGRCQRRHESPLTTYSLTSLLHLSFQPSVLH